LHFGRKGGAGFPKDVVPKQDGPVAQLDRVADFYFPPATFSRQTPPNIFLPQIAPNLLVLKGLLGYVGCTN
jgi:hypothetical protein